MYRFSVVVPLLGNVDVFEETLASVLRHRPERCQIIAVHDGRYDDPHGLADEIDFVATAPNADLIRLFNAGVDRSRGEFVGLIRPGIHLRERWDEQVASEFVDPQVGSVAPAIVDHARPHRVVAAGVATNSLFARKLAAADKRISTVRRNKIQPLGPTSWSAFYRRSLLTALGSCDEQLDPHYLDLDLALSLRQLDFDCVFCPDWIVQIEDPAWIQQESGLPHGKSAQRSLIRHAGLTGSQRARRTAIAVLTDLAMPQSVPLA